MLGKKGFSLNNLQEVVKIWKAAGLLGLGLPIPGAAHSTPALLNPPFFLQKAFLVALAFCPAPRKPNCLNPL